MNLKLIEKSAALFNDIKKLDQEIISLDAFAMALVDGKFVPKFQITGKSKEEKKVQFDEDGSLIIDANDSRRRVSGLWGIISSGYVDSNKDEEPDYKVSFYISEETTLQLLGVILGEKQRIREGLLDQLKNIGFKI